MRLQLRCLEVGRNNNNNSQASQGLGRHYSACPAAKQLKLGASLRFGFTTLYFMLAEQRSLTVLMSPSSQEIVRSYRRLYRHAMYAVQYATPARYTVKLLLENAYRTGNAADFDAQKINNTITFLDGAAKEKGLEHKILKNLLHTWYWQVSGRGQSQRCT